MLVENWHNIPARNYQEADIADRNCVTGAFLAVKHSDFTKNLSCIDKI